MSQSNINKIMISLICSAIIGLSSYLFNMNSRVAMLEMHSAQQDLIARDNRENFRKLDESISRLNTVLSILNDRLARSGQQITVPTQDGMK